MRDVGTEGVQRLSPTDIGLRRTHQRAAILEALAGCRDFVSSRELPVLSSACVSIGLTTVYRALHDLKRAEFVAVVRDEIAGRFYRQRRLRDTAIT